MPTSSNSAQYKQPQQQIHGKMGKSTAELPILLAVIGFCVILAGGLLSSYHPSYSPTTLGGVCCDTGNGAQCMPQTGPNQTLQFTSPSSPQYKGQSVQYDLLKSRTTIVECGKHMQDSGQRATYPDGQHPIVINVSDQVAGQPNECPIPNEDQLADFRSGTKVCAEFPDDELIYVCVANCEAPFGNAQRDTSCDSSIPSNKFYGNTSTVYDVYFRNADWPAPGVPDVVKNCDQGPNGVPNGGITPSTVVITGYPNHPSLQLHTFHFTQGVGQIPMARPFCKPAMYLYPQQSEHIHVAIAPKGDIIASSPTYPQTGWDVTANPSGNIFYQNTIYDYLYYEARIPDSFVPQQATGYVVAYDQLSSFFSSELPKLGLIQKEQKQFSEYWLKALPKSPYYKISLIPETAIDTISPLTISPKPDAILRLDLSFEPLDKKIDISPPGILPFTRTGFTVVEWGGMFKQDKNHPFTCLM